MLRVILLALAQPTVGIATFLIPLTSYTHSQVIASTANYQIFQNKSTKITIERLGIGGVKLSMSEAQVRKILGKPVKVENAFVPAIGKVRTLKYPGITVDLAEDAQPGKFTVYQIKTTSSKYSTIDKVKVGDTQTKVIRTYGKTEITQDGKVTNLNYIVEEPSPGGLNFTIQKGKVTEIFCFYLMN
ncbi:hypothetical protein IQ276_005140 [Desmonostoc muscorum LEGE 12446]|uniref:Uncharacterized protein n=1 Tax=Desmonostoc muscorum LEGE 12446 TaxID=1828758 RepID=A0A8J6ZTY0_DESMC|nr:hypothetical protein [Desmonostoc muscorum]MCF2145855.1 hypothetical protein [Desmonostoc muscorum LEGE 12446]